MIWIPFSKYSASQLEWAVFVLFVLDKINFLLVSTVSNSNLSSSTVLLEELLDEELITLEFTDDEEVTLLVTLLVLLLIFDELLVLLTVFEQPTNNKVKNRYKLFLIFLPHN